MNKSDFIAELSKRTDLSENECVKINEIIGENFIVGNKNKDKIIVSLGDDLGMDNQKADEIYNVVAEIVAGGVKDKIKSIF